MSVFTSLITQVLEVPDAVGQTITIRKLAPKHLDAAFKANVDDATGATTRGAVTRRLGMLGTDRLAQPLEAAHRDPLLRFNRASLLRDGVMAWSFPEMELSEAALEDLDDDTAEWLGRAILRLAKPMLFADAEEESKNDSSVSIVR